MHRLRTTITRCLITTLTLATCLLPAYAADDISISASVDRSVIALDEQLTLEITVSGNAANIPTPAAPEIPNFTAYSAGRSQNISMINGAMSSSVSLRYVLAPKTTGKFTIPPLVLDYKGNKYQTQQIAVEVVAAGKQPAVPNAPASAGSSEGKKLFVNASISAASAYVNSEVAYTFKFYRSVRLLSNPQYNAPDFTGFWTEEVPPKNYYANVNGQQYLVTELKTYLYPTKAGTFNLGSATLQCNIEDFNAQDPFSDSFFSSFFSGGKTQTLRTAPVSITVLPLPDAGKPRDFNGAVGTYTISASLDKASVRANEPVTLSVTITGNGSVKTLLAPQLPDWPDFRKYETVSSLDMSKGNDTITGSKTFKTVIIPLTAGRKIIAPVSFSFFDPAAKKYRTATTRELTLDVLPAAAMATGTTAAAATPVAAAAPVTVINRDIHYIKALKSWRRAPELLYRKPWFIAINLLPLLLLAVAGFVVTLREKLAKDPAFARRRSANTTARKYLKTAASLQKKEPSHDYYCAISRALLEYIAAKTNVSADGLTTAALTTLLKNKQVSDPTIAAVTAALNECDLVRFSPTTVTAHMKQEIYNQTAELISALEKELR